MRSGIWIILFFWVSAIGLQAQEVEVSARIDTNVILIGDQVELTLEVTHPKHTEIEWPFLVEKLGELEIVRNSKIDSVEEGNLVKESQRLYLTAWDSGYYAIPGVQFKYKDGRNRPRNKRTPGIMLEVITIEIDTTQGIFPIKDIMEVPFTWREAIPYIWKTAIGLGVLALIVFLIWKIITRNRPEEEEEEIYIPPHELALDKLKKLEKAKHWQQGEVKLYYSELTEIVREYIEGRYEIPALESTSDEIIEAFQNVDIDDAMVRKVSDVFNWADLAKFAKAEPSIENNKKSLKDSYVFVQHTKEKVIKDND